MEPVDIVIRVFSVILLTSFIPLSIISYLRWQLPDKQKRFLEIMRRCKWTGPDRGPAWVPYSLLVEIGDALEISDSKEKKTNSEQEIELKKARRNAKLDYVLPGFFATITALLGSIILLFGPVLIDPAFGKISLVLSGPFSGEEFSDIYSCISNFDIKRQLLINIQVSMFAFLGAYIWSLTHIMRRLNVIDLDSKAYYNVGIRIILSNFVVIVLYLAIQDQITEYSLEKWVPAIAFIAGWFPRRILKYTQEKVFVILRLRVNQAVSLPLEMIQGLQIFHRTRLSEAGIDDTENLANSNLIELLIRTPFNPRMLLDWIGQAKLYLLFREKIYTLREAKVRTIFEFCNIMSDEESQKTLFTFLDSLSQKRKKNRKLKTVEKEELIIAWKSCKEDQDLVWLQSARKCLLGLPK